MANVTTYKNKLFKDPTIGFWLTNSPRAAWLWLVLRVWLGYKWVDAALHKIGNPAWTETGFALKGFWTNAVAVPAEGRPPIAFDWYRSFIQALLDAEAYTWFAPLVAYSELIVGVALVLGLFTGIAAFFGGFMNWNFMMAGTASTNPMLFIVSLGLILAWKVAGYIGLDYFLLRWVGIPWKNEQNSKMPAEGGQGLVKPASG